VADPSRLRDALLTLAGEGSVFQRGVEFAEDGTEGWQFVVSVQNEDVDAINALIPVMRDRLESDRGLGRLAIDTRVAKAIGPREHPDGGFFMEWHVHVLT
jgi:hypothetical protein